MAGVRSPRLAPSGSARVAAPARPPVSAPVPVQPADVDSVSALLDELDRHYGGPGDAPRDQRNARVHDAFFGDPPAVRALVVKDAAATVVGLAAYAFPRPAADATRSLCLKELYVARRWRGTGVGRTLMAALFAEARRTGCSRVEWTTDEPNIAAREFYERLGAAVRDGKVFYRYPLD